MMNITNTVIGEPHTHWHWHRPLVHKHLITRTCIIATVIRSFYGDKHYQLALPVMSSGGRQICLVQACAVSVQPVERTRRKHSRDRNHPFIDRNGIIGKGRL
jgi:hypothetical protein